jgi:hypothetical protein
MVQNNKPCKTQNNEPMKFNGGEYNVLPNNLVVLYHYSFFFELFSLVVKRKKNYDLSHGHFQLWTSMFWLEHKVELLVLSSWEAIGLATQPKWKNGYRPVLSQLAYVPTSNCFCCGLRHASVWHICCASFLVWEWNLEHDANTIETIGNGVQQLP